MKKYLISITLFLCMGTTLSSDIFDTIGSDITKAAKVGAKKTKKAVQTVEKKVAGMQNPEKIAQDAAVEALKKMGINLPGITKNVEALKASLIQLNEKFNRIKNALAAQKSPVTQAPLIAEKFKLFRMQLEKIRKQIDENDIKTALSSPKGLDTILKKISVSSLQNNLRAAYNSFDVLINTLDGVVIDKILIEARRLLLDMAGMLDNTTHIRDYSGSLAQVMIGAQSVAAVKGISKSLRAIATNLNAIIQGGRKTIRSSIADVASNLLANTNNIPTLIQKLQIFAQTTPDKIAQLKKIIDQMMQRKDLLVKTASTIDTRLKQVVLTQLKSIKGMLDIPSVTVSELKKIVMELKKSLDGILGNGRDATGVMGTLIQKGVDEVNAFKKLIDFDIVPPRSRQGFLALPDSVRGLSQQIDRLKRALP